MQRWIFDPVGDSTALEVQLWWYTGLKGWFLFFWFFDFDFSYGFFYCVVEGLGWFFGFLDSFPLTSLFFSAFVSTFCSSLFSSDFSSYFSSLFLLTSLLLFLLLFLLSLLLTFRLYGRTPQFCIRRVYGIVWEPYSPLMYMGSTRERRIPEKDIYIIIICSFLGFRFSRVGFLLCGGGVTRGPPSV